MQATERKPKGKEKKKLHKPWAPNQFHWSALKFLVACKTTIDHKNESQSINLNMRYLVNDYESNKLTQIHLGWRVRDVLSTDYLWSTLKNHELSLQIKETNWKSIGHLNVYLNSFVTHMFCYHPVQHFVSWYCQINVQLHR